MSKRIHLGITKSQPLSHQVKESILELIQNGTLHKGDQLTPETELAGQHNLSRTTVRLALGELAREGIIKRFPKRGSFVSMRNPASVTKIGILSPIISLKPHTAHFFESDILSGFQEAFVKTKASSVYLEHSLMEDALYEQIEDMKIDGVLLVAPLKRHLTFLEKLRKNKIPSVVLSANVDTHFNFIATDNEKGGELVVEHLAKLGHKRIGAVFSDTTMFDSLYRHQGYCNALKKYHLSPNKELIRRLPWVEWFPAAYKVVKTMLKKPSSVRPTALFAAGLEICLGAKKAIDELGLVIPDDISLIAFDDAPSLQYASPPVSTVVQPIREIGRLGVEKILSIIRERPEEPCQISLQPELVIRKSTGKPKEA